MPIKLTWPDFWDTYWNNGKFPYFSYVLEDFQFGDSGVYIVPVEVSSNEE